MNANCETIIDIQYSLDSMAFMVNISSDIVAMAATVNELPEHCD